MAATVVAASTRFLDAYYIVNSLLVLVYVPLVLHFRLVTPDGTDFGSIHSLHALGTWEQRILGAIGSYVCWQFIRKRSLDQWAQQVFLYGQVMVALTMYQIDQRLLVWYALLWWGAKAVCPQPMYPLVAASQERIMELSPPTLKERVTSSGSDATWLVFFYAQGHTESIAMAPAFAELADRYAGSRLQFGSMDGLLWPNVSKDLKLTPSTWSAQLPAVVLYHKGKEVDRLPRAADVDGLGLKRNHYTKADVVNKLKLDRYAGSTQS